MSKNGSGSSECEAMEEQQTSKQQLLPEEVEKEGENLKQQLQQQGEDEGALALLEQDEYDDEEIRQLQLEVESFAAKVHRYRAEGPALIASRLQQSLEEMRPRFPPLQLDQDDNQSNSKSGPDSELSDLGKDDDPAIAQARLLKSRISALNAGMPALLQRMKRCLEELDKKQTAASRSKPVPQAFTVSRD